MNGPSPQAAETSNASPAPKPKVLSCTSCRRRKIKCDKEYPCQHCQSAGVTCVFPTRVTKARPKEKGSKSRDVELLKRISHLESLVKKIDASKVTEDDFDLDETESEVPVDETASLSLADPHLNSPFNPFSNGVVEGKIDEQYAFLIKRQAVGLLYLNDNFWTSLSDEVGSLRQLIEADESDEEELYSASPTSVRTSAQSAQSAQTTPHFVFSDHGQLDPAEPYYPSQPSQEHQSILFQTYFDNVHPVCHLLHKPLAIPRAEELLDPASGRFKFPSIEASTFAMYYAAVTSLSSENCLAYFQEGRDVLLARYKRGTEVALTQADFLNSMEIVTLQAFVLYITVLRSHDQSRKSWSLIGLAVRIAHALGLHRDGDGTRLAPFDAEMRRRLWWMLVVLDTRACEDRGSEPLIIEASFDTHKPSNINDSDFTFTSVRPLPKKNGITEMTFGLLTMECSHVSLKVNFIPTGRPSLTISQKETLVKQLQQRFETKYLDSHDSANPHQWYVAGLARLLVSRLWLAVQYPLQSRKSTQHLLPRGQSLKNVVAYLSLHEQMSQHPLTKQFNWFFGTYVPWHGLAVCLAELCVHTKGDLADQGWRLVDLGFSMWADGVADTKDGVIWRPVKNLYKRAKAARLRATAAADVPAAPQRSVDQRGEPKSNGPPRAEDITTPEFGLHVLSPPSQVQSTMYNNNIMDINPLAQMAFPDLGFDYSTPMDLGMMSNHGLEMDINMLGTPGPWNEWNQFVGDVGAEGAGDGSLSMGEGADLMRQMW